MHLHASETDIVGTGIKEGGGIKTVKIVELDLDRLLCIKLLLFPLLSLISNEISVTCEIHIKKDIWGFGIESFFQKPIFSYNHHIV